MSNPAYSGLLRYGHERRAGAPLAPRRPGRYLAFDADMGGFNNILMNFEIMVVLAALSGRTLVLPPARPFYLLGDAPRLLTDFFDREALARFVDVLDAKEFVGTLGWPAEAERSEEFHRRLGEFGYNPGWNSDQDVCIHPATAVTARFELIPRLGRRRPVALAREADDAKILYFPSTEEHRILGPVETFFLFGDPADERRTRALVRDAVRYHPRLLDAVERILASPPLAGEDFGAMHIRRGDFQYAETRIAVEAILERTRGIFEPGQPLYVATDERTATFLEPLRQTYRVTTYGDLPSELTAPISYEWTGIAETLLCAAAPGKFVGTRLSTFSARISTLRGYISTTPAAPLSGVDTTLYFTQPPLHGGPEPDPRAETAEPWWESVRHTPLWGRAYEAAWAEAD